MKLQTLLCLAAITACAADSPIPRIEHKDGRCALMVDNAPYLVLGAQVNNSSAWPAMLPQVWPAVEYIHANTLEAPIYWEQLERQPGQFDYSVVDALLGQAREHNVRLVLLWFGTWKNGSGHYMPEWIKTRPDRYPRVQGADGKPVDSPSPFAEATMEADTKAFSALMRHLKAVDPQRTVIMVQVENEAGTWGSVRDYSPAAQKAIQSPVPQPILVATGKQSARGTWQEVFGADAEEFFHAWAVARYIERVAAAGKAEYPLPMFANAALRDPFAPGRPPAYESGGPTDNVLDIWKAAAPSLDVLAPDIYMNDSRRAFKVMDLYHRKDNPLFVPEIGNAPVYAPFFFAALAHNAIGFAPFGIDYTGYNNAPLGAPRVNEESLAPFALNYRLVAPMARELARLAFEGKLHAIVEEKGKPSAALDLGAWKAAISYGVPQFGFGANPPGNPEPTGRALIAQLADNQFLVAGFFCRVDFQVSGANAGKQRQYLRVEEGVYEDGFFRFKRIWNGDQTDWGLNFTSTPQILRVSLATY